MADPISQDDEGRFLPPEGEFARLARAWSPFFRSLTRIAIALKGRDGLYLRYALTILSVDKPPPGPDLRVETKSIKATRYVVDVDAEAANGTIDALLRNPDQIRGGDWSAKLAFDGAVLNFDYQRFFPPRLPGANRLPTLQVVAHPNRVVHFPSQEALDLELLANETPFESVSELLSELNLPVNPSELIERSIAELVILPPAFFDAESKIAGGMLSVHIGAHPSIDPKKLRVGYKALPAGGPVRRSAMSGEALAWHCDGKVNRGHIQIEMSGVPLALMFLSFDGEFLSKWWVRDQTDSFNERALIQRAIDPGDVFGKGFFESKSDFEDRIGLLLDLLGLSSLKYGQIARLTDGPDIVVLSAQRHLYVIECTTGDINNRGKLHRLYDRAKRIGEVLSQSRHPPASVMPMIFTSLLRRETVAHRHVAESLKIGLFCREDIAHLLTEIDAPPTPEELHRRAIASIPTDAAAAASTLLGRR